MNKLKQVIEEYGRWSEISKYVERIEIHIDSDFSISVENSKALLESIGKDICRSNGVKLAKKISMNKVLKNAFSSMNYTNDSLVSQVSTALATIGQQVGNLRNEIGVTSHGKTLEEIEKRNDNIDLVTKGFLIDMVELVSVFLIRNFEVENTKTPNELLIDSLNYSKAGEFNEAWDDLFGVFSMGEYSYQASEILFYVDKQAYLTEYRAFKKAESE